MKGDATVIEALNEILVGELTAINQYFLHARICQSKGYEKLGGKIYHESIDEMKHAQSLTDRILLVEGLPNFQKLNKISIGENVREILEADLALEMKARENLLKAIDVCFEKKDHVTRELFEHILTDEESHIDWIESQLGIINEIGLERYLAEQI